MAKQKVAPRRKYTTITIPTPLFESIKKSIETTGFSSVSDYATYILRETVAEMNGRKKKSSEDASITEKLRALGYIS
ncbi:CopG family transcriptional regulator [Candidatus Marsarchaeota archaeon]|nr:CopG family transcriptional regulator [Candidatus Marsarchaeota archaeon]MCL5404831.1 CopG family transcriptional regulator [Candidatus Marsarchaeota archaeon]